MIDYAQTVCLTQAARENSESTERQFAARQHLLALLHEQVRLESRVASPSAKLVIEQKGI